MRFSKEFKQWYEKHFELSFPKQVKMNYYCFNFKAIYDAFNAHNEELDRLRRFEKEVRKLQDKCNKYSEKSSDYWTSNRDKSVEYEMKYIFKFIGLMIAAIFISGFSLWCLQDVPLYHQIIMTMENITGYHLTFLDYLKTAFCTFLVSVLVKGMGMIFKMILED